MNAEQMAHEIAHVIGGDVATTSEGWSVLTNDEPIQLRFSDGFGDMVRITAQGIDGVGPTLRVKASRPLGQVIAQIRRKLITPDYLDSRRAYLAAATDDARSETAIIEMVDHWRDDAPPTTIMRKGAKVRTPTAAADGRPDGLIDVRLRVPPDVAARLLVAHG